MFSGSGSALYSYRRIKTELFINILFVNVGLLLYNAGIMLLKDIKKKRGDYI